ncbi:MAG TPA: hypothetical protein VIF57_08190 [Polyangia bacterium]
MNEADEQTRFTVRYQLTTADVRGAIWSTAGEWLGFLIGIALLTLLCAIWRPLGNARFIGALAFPAITVWWFLARLNRATRALDPYVGKDFVLSLDATGLRLESALMNVGMPWTSIRSVTRYRAYWFFHGKNSEGRFFVPAAAIPAEARAYVARWAAAAGARLT